MSERFFPWNGVPERVLPKWNEERNGTHLFLFYFTLFLNLHFSTYLEPPLYFPPSSKWRVALLSASIMNRFHLPFSDLERSMYILLLNDDDEEDYSQPLMLSRGLGSMNKFNSFFHSEPSPSVHQCPFQS